ncbi:MAG: hypothetical protein ACRD3N_08935 [Terracidiphilus sp.]
MQTPFYFLSTVAAICAAYFLWTIGIRKLRLDVLRENLFELRFQLFHLGMSGELPFDDDAYRAVEILLNGLLRFGHRISFLTYLLSQIETARAKKDKDYVDVSAQIALKIARVDPETQKKIRTILEKAHSAVIGYMALSSLFVLSLYVATKALGIFGVRLDGAKVNARDAIEREAYLAECRRGLRLAAA